MQLLMETCLLAKLPSGRWCPESLGGAAGRGSFSLVTNRVGADTLYGQHLTTNQAF